jgi:XTP/dITP diphosphohydrolase
MQPIELVIASHNLYKVRELKTLLKPFDFLDILSLKDFPDYHLPPETGKTFEENAIIKALSAAKHLHKWTLAEDSGLIVPALQGEPGIFSARYAGKNATDQDNRKKLLEKMHHLKPEERNAYFLCAVALATPSGSIKKCVSATCEGFILTEEQGRGGFGYDALFVKHDYRKSFASLDDTIKNRISHRKKAIDKLLPSLESIRRQHALLH